MIIHTITLIFHLLFLFVSSTSTKPFLPFAEYPIFSNYYIQNLLRKAVFIVVCVM